MALRTRPDRLRHTSRRVYTCGTCQKRVLSKGWGAHIDSEECRGRAALYQAGYQAALLDAGTAMADAVADLIKDGA